MERYQGRFLASLYPSYFPLLVLLLLAVLPGTAEATICIQLPAVSVKEVTGLVIIDHSRGEKAEEPLPGTLVYLIKVTPRGRANVAEATTDKNGRFRIPGIRPGLYTIGWQRDGFVQTERLLRVRRFALRRRVTLVLVMDADPFGCGGWLELRKNYPEVSPTGDA